MIRISIYHWLPIADNLLYKVEKRLRALPPYQVNNVELERDALTFHSTFQFNRGFRSATLFPLPSKINQRGFCQHVLTIAPIPGIALHTLLNDMVPELQRVASALLYAISPDSVRSTLAILNTGVAPFQQFQTTTLDPPLEQAVNTFLNHNQVTAILLDEHSAESLRAGFSIPNLDIHIQPFTGNAGAFTSVLGNTIVFYSKEFTPDEWATHDSVIYKYCALVLYARMLDYATSALKQALDHVIPLRRSLVSALQGNTAKQFETLTYMKRYLMYVNIKLPVIQKVIHHLQATRNTQTFAAKIATFDEPIKVFGYPTIRTIEDTVWQPPYLIGKIDDETLRLKTLMDEDIGEIQFVSSELSQLLQISLLSEQLQVAQDSLAVAKSKQDVHAGAREMSKLDKLFILLAISTWGISFVNVSELATEWIIVVCLVLCVVYYALTAFARKHHTTTL